MCELFSPLSDGGGEVRVYMCVSMCKGGWCESECDAKLSVRKYAIIFI